MHLADFGLSAFLARDQYMKGRAGSCHFMAPEVIKGHYRAKADTWSLGILLHFLLSGQLPFTGTTGVVRNDDIISHRVPA